MINRFSSLSLLSGGIASTALFTTSLTASADDIPAAGDFMADAFNGGSIVAPTNGFTDGRLRDANRLRIKTTGDNAGGQVGWLKFDISSLSFDKTTATDAQVVLDIERLQNLTNPADGIGVVPHAIELWAIKDGLASTTVNNVVSPGTDADGNGPGTAFLDGSTPALTLSAIQQGENFDPDLADPDLNPLYYNWNNSGGPFPWDDGVLEGGLAGGPGLNLTTVGESYGPGPGDIPFNEIVDPAKADLVSVWYPTDTTGIRNDGADPGTFAIFSDSNTRPDSSAYSGPSGAFVDLLLPENPGTLTDLILNDTNDVVSFVLVAKTPSNAIGYFFYQEGNSLGGAAPTLRVVPEPATAGILGLGSLAMMLRRRKG